MRRILLLVIPIVLLNGPGILMEPHRLKSVLLDAKIFWLVQAHHEGLESVAILQLHGELLRGVRTWDSSDSHAVEMACRARHNPE